MAGLTASGSAFAPYDAAFPNPQSASGLIGIEIDGLSRLGLTRRRCSGVARRLAPGCCAHGEKEDVPQH